ncbi:solute carrier family 22 member 18 [Callorhinchus milii]|uniref:solute carrier family 22 member 18 n=1 Tax=Callorhinchus milii TaxID=7868 RepID=UPI001C3F5715|nr:solute carrier family 22 member 18 [Callorhinchus milii]
MTLYSTFFWIQTGVMPYLSRRLGMDTVVFGYLQTAFAVIQLLGGPVFGRFGDLFGGRAALSLAYISSGLTYLLMGLSTNIPLLFLSRIPSVFMHGIQAVQMVVTDLSAESERASSLGKLGLSYGVGMIVGSLTGGILISRFGEPATAYVAAVGSLLNAAIAVKYIPAHTKPQSVTQQHKAGQATGSVFSLKTITRLMSIPGAAKIFTIKIITGIPSGVFQSMFSVVAMDYFKLDAEHNGYLMAYIGLLQMVMQGLVVGWLTRWIPEQILILCSILLVCLMGLAMAMMTNVIHFCVTCIPMSLGIAIFSLTTNSILTKLAPAADTGAMLGLSMSVYSLIRSISPTIGGFLFDAYGFPSFGYLQFGVNLLLFLSLCPSTCSRPTLHPKQTT